MENHEIWKSVVGYEGIYEVSSLGRVKRIKAAQGTRAGLVLTPIKGKRKYLSVHLHSNRSRRLVRVHRIVAEAFHGVSDLPLVRHLDDNPMNNRPENLRHGTPAENHADAIANRGQWDTSNSPATHCRNGHEYTPENTKNALANGGRPTRKCRTCLRMSSQRRYWRKKASQSA